ncbi:S-layer homology domain-containing protein [Paenibacillus eucommiae]|uniref:SLH domain-containing protein n=1 Tax=Paenibacillus eucommiae TaxID=1355755 RepID=A0ABS4J2M3_9BACL|nr:S-layer homology domain-containing protein [Paenibacillus eucommiae]MBP1993356.1 hypothetical protein [Paenibacillus eucommiae]
MKKILFKKLVATGLALTMVLGGGTAAFAHGKDYNDNKGNSYTKNDQSKNKNNKNDNKNNNKNDKKNEIRINFDDLKGKDIEWALRYIASLASQRIFEGYEDGTFKPYNVISRIEAITAAVRLMGLREQAESPAEMATKLNFKDADKIPSWAVGYVAVALKNDLFNENDTSVQPQKNADRLWATTLLVKALKLEGEAKAKMNEKLPFKDADKVPAGSVGYVAVAISKGLIDGFEDNTFRPNDNVTRAQLAALLDRTGEQFGEKDTVTGTVAAAVANNVLPITKNGSTVQLVLDPNAFIFRGGVKVNPSALQVGDQVKVRSYNNLVIFVEVVKQGAVNNNFSAVGTLNATTLNTNGSIATISITQNINGNNQTTFYNVSPNVQITGNLAQFVQGHLIELKGKDQVVTTIEVK